MTHHNTRDSAVDAPQASPAGIVSTTVGQPVKSAARVLDILEYLATNGASSLHQLAKELRLPKSSLHALLRTMQGRGWAETDATGTIYSLGIHSLLVGSAYLDGDMIVGRTSPILDDLSRTTGETVHLARLEGDQVVYTAKRESLHPLRMFSAVGRSLPAYATALGRAILAELTDEQAGDLVPDIIEPITPHTVTDRDHILAKVKEARGDGYATESEESCLGVSCFAVALPFSQPARHAISVAVPLTRLDDTVAKQIVAQILAAKGKLAQQPFTSTPTQEG